MPTPLLIYALKVGMFQQPGRARKTCSRLRRGLLYTPFRSVGAHQLTFLHK